MKPIFGPMRPPFLILTPACVALGAAVSYRSGLPIDALHLILVLVGAVAAHVAVNVLNEYVDFRTGLDTHTRRTPFSGGSGTLPLHPDLAPATLAVGLIASALVLAIGFYFIAVRGLAILPVGVLGVVLMLVYSPWLTRRPWLCLIAPGLGFGPCMVVGTEVALTGHASAAGWLASLVPLFLVSNLLLLNQFPDVEADRTVGRRNVPILLGLNGGARTYQLFFLLAAFALAGVVVSGLLPPLSMLGFVGLSAAVPVFRRLSRTRGALGDRLLLSSLALNVAASVATPLLVAIGVFMAPR